MHSFLIVSDSKDKQQKELQKLIDPLAIDPVDRTTISEEGSIGIEVVRKIKQTIHFKPFSSKTKAVIIENAQNITVDAQNALLKLLEEPPDNTIIVLLCDTLTSILPTVESRCTIITPDTDTKKVSQKELTSATETLQQIVKAPMGERLAFAQSVTKSKDDAIELLEIFLTIIREDILEKTKTNVSTKLQRENAVRIIEAHTLLEHTNANPRLIVENLFLNLR